MVFDGIFGRVGDQHNFFDARSNTFIYNVLNQWFIHQC